MFEQATLGKLQRMGRPPNWKLELTQQVRQGTQMIFMAVRQKHPVHTLTLRKEPTEVRMPDVDAHVVVGEGGAAIDDHDAARLLQGEAVHANLPQATEGDDANQIGR